MTFGSRWHFPVVNKTVLIPVTFGLVMALTASTESLATDCIQPSGPVARVICSDSNLVLLDEDMGDAFRELIRSIPRASRPSALRDQRDWLNRRNRCLGSVDVNRCLADEIELRITDLSQGLAGAIGADFPGRDTSPPPPPGNRSFEHPHSESAAEPQGQREALEQEPLADVPVGGNPNPATEADPSHPVPPRMGEPNVPTTPPGDDDRAGDATGDRITGTEPPPAPPPADADADADADTVTEPVGPALLDGVDAKAIADFLSASVWRAEIASGVRPGTIYIFHSNGLLVTADCVEAYRIGSWRIEGAGLRLKDGSGRDMAAEIVESGNGFIRLKMTERREKRVLDLVFRSVRSPFACTG